MRLLPVAIVLLLALPATAEAADVPKGPSGSSFYEPPSPLPGSTHGAAIWQRKLKGDAALTSARSNRRLLYRSVGSDGAAIAVSGTVSLPKGKAPRKGWPVITYGHGTTGIADLCAPSLDSEDNPAHGHTAYAYPLLNRWLRAGFAVVRTDYQGLGTPGEHEFLNGREEGRAMLDMVRAARRLDDRLGKRVAITGHSQGGHAGLWAAALASSWTPELKVRGTVVFAPVSHLAEQAALLRALTSPGGITGLAAMIVRGIDTMRTDLDPVPGLTDRAAVLYPETLTKCLRDLQQPASFGGLAPADVFRSDYDLAPLIAALSPNDPEDLKIPTRVRVEQGTADTTVFKTFTDQLVQKYEDRDNRVVYKTYEGVDHADVVKAAAKDSTRWLKRRR